MLQGPFKLTVTASINPLFMESQPGWKQTEGEVESGCLGSALCSLALSLTLDTTWQKKAGLMVKISNEI